MINSYMCKKNTTKKSTKKTDFDRSMHVGSGVAKIQQSDHRQTDGQPVDKRHVVD